MTIAKIDRHGDDKWKFILTAASVAVASFLTLWFLIAYNSDTIYPHFFYVPIIMASFWYQKRGMYVALYLSALQLLVHYMFNMQGDIADNLFRFFMFMFVSFITATLSERLTKEQAELRESGERFRNLVETTSDWVWEVDKSGVYTYASPAVSYLLGYEPEYVMGKTPFDLMSSAEAKRVAEIFGRFVAERKPINYLENINLHKDGRQVILETCAVPFFDPAGIFIGYRGVDRDITERKKSEVFIKNILESIGEGFIVIDPDYRIITANRAFCEQNKILLEDIINRHCYEILHHRDKPCFEAGERCAPQHTFATGEPCTELHTHYDKEGTPAYIATRSYPMKDQAGKVISIIEIANDITKRKKAAEEREILINELDIKNRELEQILYAATHDLKTPLVNINGYCSELKQSIEGIVSLVEIKEMSSGIRKDLISLTKELPESFGFVKMNISRMDMLLNGLLAFSRSGKVELKIQDIDMNMLISGISGNLNDKLEETGASLEVTELPRCTGDREQINRVFSNLIENAVKYLDPARKGKVKVSGHMEDDSSVYCVEDNGIGIAFEHQKQIFHIFHQLDPAKGGKGLGLMIVQRIVERHNGKMWLESEAGRGSRFFVKLPGVKLTS